MGLFRVPVPRVDLAAFREAVANALIHHGYHRLGAVPVRLHDAGLTVSNPGGLVDGVTLAKLLTTEPRPRRRTQADAMKRIGLVEAHGIARGRSYTLSAAVYQRHSDKAAYTRQAGFAPIQHEQMVLSYARQHGHLKRAEVMELCRLSTDQAAKLLQRMKAQGLLVQQGERRWATYSAAA